MLIASTNAIDKIAQRVFAQHRKQLICILFKYSAVDLLSSPEDLLSRQSQRKRATRQHQQDAIKSDEKGFQTVDREQTRMACSRRQDMDSFRIKEKLHTKRMLVIVPSLSLLSQTLREWKEPAKRIQLDPGLFRLFSRKAEQNQWQHDRTSELRWSTWHQ